MTEAGPGTEATDQVGRIQQGIWDEQARKLRELTQQVAQLTEALADKTAQCDRYMEQATAEAAGRMAGEQGMPAVSNPFAPHQIILFRAWQNGWREVFLMNRVAQLRLLLRDASKIFELGRAMGLAEAKRPRGKKNLISPAETALEPQIAAIWHAHQAATSMEADALMMQFAEVWRRVYVEDSTIPG
jgi:hypothetical protein